MESGFVDYKICDKDFDCDNCAFDKAIHGRGASNGLTKNGRANGTRNKSPKFNIAQEIPAELIFSKNHVWLKKIESDYFFLGVDHFAQNIIKKITTFQFPFVGSKISKGEPIVSILGEWGVASIPSPINCVIQKINSELLLDVGKFFSDDIYQTWLLKVKATEIINQSLFHKSEKYKEQLNEVITNIKNIAGTSKIGATMYDGGELISNLPDHLNKKEYVHLLNLIFNNK